MKDIKKLIQKEEDYMGNIWYVAIIEGITYKCESYLDLVWYLGGKIKWMETKETTYEN